MTDDNTARNPEPSPDDDAAPRSSSDAAHAAAEGPGRNGHGGAAGGVGALHDRLADAVESGAFGEARGGAAALLAAPVTLRAVLGQARIPVSRFLSLDAGDTLQLDRPVGEPIDITVNDSVIARAEIVMLDEDAGTLGVRVTELVAA